MRRAILCLSVGALLLAFVPAAGADPPETVPQEGPFEFTILDCGFEIRLTGYGNGLLRVFDDWGGVYVEHSTGSIHATLTNVGTGASIERNISGPGLYREYPDGSSTYTLPGPSLFWEMGDPQLPPVFINQGRFRFVADADGNFTYTHIGRVEDICAALS